MTAEFRDHKGRLISIGDEVKNCFLGASARGGLPSGSIGTVIGFARTRIKVAVPGAEGKTYTVNPRAVEVQAQQR